MIAVIFEVVPATGRAQAYFDLAADLKPYLVEIDGFISIERFESLAEPGKFLSLSFWRDEAAIAAWRNLQPHRAAQSAGRESILAGYRLRRFGTARLRHDGAIRCAGRQYGDPRLAAAQEKGRPAGGPF